MTYLIDVNLPISFSQIKTITCLFIKDLSDAMPDNEIWQMAIANNTPYLPVIKTSTIGPFNRSYYLK
jgi:hypothetical protein